MKNIISFSIFLLVSFSSDAKTRIYFNGSFNDATKKTYINKYIIDKIKPAYYKIYKDNKLIKSKRIKNDKDEASLSNNDLILESNLEEFALRNKINTIVFLGGVPEQYKNKSNYVDFEIIRFNLYNNLKDKNTIIINNPNLGKLEINWNTFIQKSSTLGNISGLITLTTFKSVMSVKIRTNNKIYTEGYSWNKSYYSNQKFNIYFQNLSYQKDDFWISIEVTDSSGHVFIKEYTDLPIIKTQPLSELNYMYYTLSKDVLKPVRHISNLYYGIPVNHLTSLLNKYITIRITSQNRVLTNKIDNNNLVICNNNKTQIVLINPIPDNDLWCGVEWGIVEISIQDEYNTVDQLNKSNPITLKAWPYDPDANYPTVEEAFCIE